MGPFLDKIPYSILAVFSIVMLLIPFKPMPHALEKLMMLKNGTLNNPVDIFDLIYHTSPSILLAMKIFRDGTKKMKRR